MKSRIFALAATAMLLMAASAQAQSDNLGNHQATQSLVLNNFDLRLRNAADGNHGLGYYGFSTSPKNWLGQDIDGPVLYGFAGGALGTNQAGALATALTWTRSGRIGIGTPSPALLLHLCNSNTPAVRLEQDGAGGFSPQTWDVAGNEANFFVRDITGGSRLPFRIRPGAPTSSIDIAASGNVGIGTNLPEQKLHVRNGSAPALRLEQDNADGLTPQTWDVAGNEAHFFVRDATNNNLQPFRIRPGAPTSSIDVAASGNVGFGTSAPTLRVHLLNGNTPALRLEQNGTGGFTPQTWDIGANEANFFVRDATNSSRLPFRIRPGAPTSSIDIAASGNVGIGTTSPQARLDVRGNVKVSNANTLEFGAGITGKQALAGTIGYGNLTADALNIVGAGSAETDRKVVVYSEGGMLVKGSLTLEGAAVSTSDARLKTSVRPLSDALSGVLRLQGRRYLFKPGQGPQGEQLGFIAQELEQVYPELVLTGADGLKAVNYAQLTAVLVEALKEQQRQIEALKAEVAAGRTASAAALEARLQALEKQVSAGMASK